MNVINETGYYAYTTKLIITLKKAVHFLFLLLNLFLSIYIVHKLQIFQNFNKIENMAITCSDGIVIFLSLYHFYQNKTYVIKEEQVVIQAQALNIL